MRHPGIAATRIKGAEVGVKGGVIDYDRGGREGGGGQPWGGKRCPCRGVQLGEAQGAAVEQGKVVEERGERGGTSLRIVDAKGVVLGRLEASHLSVLLQGKDKPTYNPSKDDGDIVVVVNAKEIELTGRKFENKVYR